MTVSRLLASGRRQPMPSALVRRPVLADHVTEGPCVDTMPAVSRIRVLITGGAGFIGSTVASACADAGFEPIIVDNLTRGARDFVRDFEFHEVDCGDREAMTHVIDAHPDLFASSTARPT